MSTEVAKVGSLLVTSFYGGGERGPCIQLTPDTAGGGYSTLTREQVVELVAVLLNWLDGVGQPFDEREAMSEVFSALLPAVGTARGTTTSMAKAAAKRIADLELALRELLGFAERNKARAEKAVDGTARGITARVEAEARLHEAARVYLVVRERVQEALR